VPAKGDGITKRKDGRWMGRYFIQTPEGPKRKHVYGKKYREAERKLNEARANADKGLVFDADNLKLGQWLDCWLDDLLKPLVDAGKLAHSTYVRYRGIANNHLKPALGHRKLKDLTRAEIRRLYAQKGESLAPRSVDYIHVTLQKALSQAVRDDLIHRNVAAGERPRSSRQREEAKALSPAQVRALLTAARGERNEALYTLAVHTGLRQGELLGLKWTDVELDAGSPKLSVRRSLKVTEGGLGFGPPKNRASRRGVPLNETAAAALRAHKARQNAEMLATPAWQDHGLVFPNRVGKPMNPSNLYHREYKPLLKEAGLEGEDFTFHSLRHTFASGLCNKREYPKVIQGLLGHSSITQTMDTYSHLMEGMGEDAVDGLDDAFGATERRP
jgi:integrase